MPLKLKKEHENTVVGFNKSSLPLGKRKDLHKLYELSSQNPNILNYFDEIPTAEELDKIKGDFFNANKSTKFELK